ncbi:transposase [Exilibacterium tricleocarpae]|uniref:transposase n=1 Tax=Exilibacterium tricleocarpae TaxID=2591008 RepID=UPI001C553988|nr:transposase [Exilibacterium tricleocarpae]
MARKNRQAYTEEFRREAVKRAGKEGNTTASIAKELGVSPQQIYNWRCQYNCLSGKQFNTMDGVDYSKKESEEIRKLKREKAALEKELEFVRKAAACFANHQE